jgi:hypothetical protein
MPGENVISEYLVKLGFTRDTIAYNQFLGSLREVESQVNNRYLNMAKKAAEFQFATLGAFAAIGAGTLGFMDRVAQADQNYRLFALRMYTSLPVARELKVALDALGQPLENVMFDPELAERFHQLVKDQQVMAEQLGPNFEANMRSIRDARFEVTRFGVELKYLGMNVVNDLFKAFGKGGDDLMANLRHFNAWFIANIPFFSYWITSKLKPMLLDIRDVFKTIWDEIKNIDLNKVAADVQTLIKALSQVSEMMVHLVGAAIDLGEGRFKDALGELKKAASDVNLTGPAIRAAVKTGVIAQTVQSAKETISTHEPIAEKAQAAAREVSARTGIPANIIYQQWAYETAGFSSDLANKQNNLGGLKIPGTNDFQSFSSLGDFSRRDIAVLQAYIKRHGGIAPQTIQEFAQMLEGGKIKYAPDRTAGQYAAGMAHYGDINVTINAGPNAKPYDIAQEVKKVLSDLSKPSDQDTARVQRNLNEWAIPSWSYGQ